MAVAYSVAPTVTVDGADLQGDIARHIEQVVVDEDVDLPAMFAISLMDPRRDILDRSGMRVGAQVEVSIAGQGASSDEPLVKGDVVTVECDYDEFGARVVVRGYAASHRLHPGRHTRTFVNVTDSDIVKKVAGEAGIELGEIEETTEVHEHVAQANVSDWEFLSARARAIGFELSVVMGRLRFGPPTSSADAPPDAAAQRGSASRDPRVLKYGENLIAFHARISAAEQVAEVKVRGWDDARKEAVVGSAPGGTVAATLDLADPASLAHFLGDPALVAVDASIASQGVADTVAKALAERIGSAFATADGVAVGNTSLRAGLAVRVAGVGEDFSGTYVLSQARHVIDGHGYRTHFSIRGRHAAPASTPESRAASAGEAATGFTGFVRGIVSQVDDPEKLGRVKVKLPWLADDFDSTWAPVMQLGAGPKSGTFFLPAVGDEVVVGFEQGLVDRPIVVGGLFNGLDEPPSYGQWLDNGAVTGRGIYSRKGHFVELWDGDDISGVHVATAGDEASLALDARDRKLVLQSAGAFEVSADGEITIHGSKITVQADGNLVLKGAQIQLN
jgi:phage protein D/phage baseplate assembly protein gpV